jgi:N-acetylglucosamine kinase-like BadF-type ATPase
MTWFLGVDAGGTFTRAALWNPEDDVLVEGHAGAGNPAAVGDLAAFQAIEQAVAGALGQAGLHAREVSVAVLGVAGLARSTPPVSWDEWMGNWGIGDLRLVPDLQIAHYATFRGNPGIHLIAGTGSSVVLCDAEGAYQYLGGWGWLIDDAGSAVDLGRRALARTGQLVDAGDDCHPFVQAVLKRCRCETPEGLIPFLYGHQAPRTAIAELAPLVTHGAGEGEREAAKIIEEAATALASTIRSAAARLSTPPPFPLTGSGGVLQAPAFRSAMDRILGADFEWKKQTFSPLAGALLMAAERALNAHRDSFLESLRIL